MATVQEALALALDHHLAGRVTEAEILYGRILKADPENPDALHLHGVLCAQTGRLDAGVELLRQAARARPDAADICLNLANALRAHGLCGEAADAYAETLRMAPNRAEAAFGLALSLDLCGRREEGVTAYRALLNRHPDHAHGWNNYLLALRLLDRTQEAVAALAVLRAGHPEIARLHLRHVLMLDPADALAWNELALAERRAGRLAGAVTLFRRAIMSACDQSAARSNLANLLRELGQPDRALAEACAAIALDPAAGAILGNLALVWEGVDRPADAARAMERVVRLDPADAEGWSYLGAMLRRRGRIASGLDACNRALALDPALAAGLANRAVVLQDFGRIEAAIRDNRRLVATVPDSADHHSNLLLSLQYSDAVGPAELLTEHRRWDERHGRPRTVAAACHGNPPDPGRRLKVGYVSADFGYHPIGYFLAPVLPAHDRAAVEVFCYNAKLREDGMTRRLRAASDHWRSICGLDDDAAAGLIREDGIDILVDLAGHTGGNRLTLFAARPAPVQVTWAGYVGTTGLSAMDSLIACPRHMPAGTDWTAVEQVVRLPDDYVCVMPRENAPAVGPLPLLSNGHVTFGCFNNRTKLSAGTLALWARLLDRVPGARLHLKTHQFEDPAVRAALLVEFAALGGDPGRVDFSGAVTHFALPDWYNRIDVALDPFPYSGGLTTLEALWMGVPVVTLGGGDRFCARHSVGHLTAAGLTDLIAAAPEDYLATAARLANDPDGLAALRAGLRERMAASPLCDGPRFTRHLEAAYRQLWQRWCASA